MRHIGDLPTQEQAQRFGDYLKTRGISARIDQADETWEVWVYDEDFVQTAQADLTRFLQDPEAAEFVEAARAAGHLRKDQERRLNRALKKRKAQVYHPVNPRDPMNLPVTLFLLGMSILISFFVSIGDMRSDLIPDLTITSFQRSNLNMISYNTTLSEIREGEVWRLVTPIFLHWNWLHLVMNMIITYQLSTLLEPFIRSLRFTGLVLMLAVVSNLTQFYWSGPSFGGMSGVAFGLFGYLWIRGHVFPASGMQLRRDVVYFFLGFLVLCFTGIFGPIANAAHLAGLLTGCGMAALIPIWRSLFERRA